MVNLIMGMKNDGHHSGLPPRPPSRSLSSLAGVCAEIFVSYFEESFELAEWNGNEFRCLREEDARILESQVEIARKFLCAIRDRDVNSVSFVLTPDSFLAKEALAAIEAALNG